MRFTRTARPVQPRIDHVLGMIPRPVWGVLTIGTEGRMIAGQRNGTSPDPKASAQLPLPNHERASQTPSGRSTAWGWCVSAYDALRRLLADRPISFHPERARVLGGINEALFVQKIAYWSDNGDDPEWMCESAD